MRDWRVDAELIIDGVVQEEITFDVHDLVTIFDAMCEAEQYLINVLRPQLEGHQVDLNIFDICELV